MAIATPREQPKGAWLTPREASSGGGGASNTLKSAAGCMGLSATGTGTTHGGFRMGANVAPSVRPAGKAGGIDVFERGLNDHVVIPTPMTPENFSDLRNKYRKRTEPGEIAVHWGMLDRRPPDPGDGYGVKSNKGFRENVAQNFKSGQKAGIAEYINSRAESIYKSTREEPLGTGYRRGHKLPDATRDALFPGFGCATDRGAITGKECIFPRDVKPEDAEAKRLYKRTHGNYDPGESINRDYTWPKSIREDSHFRFGKAVEASEPGRRAFGAKEALSVDAEDDTGGFPRTRVVKKSSEDAKHVQEDHLGASRNLKQGRPPVKVGHAFGIPSGADKTDAAELVRGFYSASEQLPDKDLGKCLVAGRRNFMSATPMGVPSVRTDVVGPPIEKRSVANAVNYGDDLHAFSLIFPNKSQLQGISVDDFQLRRDRDDLRQLLEGAGMRMSQSDFEMLFTEAARLYEDDKDQVSLDVAMHFYADWTTDGNISNEETKLFANTAAAALDTYVPEAGALTAR